MFIFLHGSFLSAFAGALIRIYVRRCIFFWPVQFSFSKDGTVLSDLLLWNYKNTVKVTKKKL